MQSPPELPSADRLVDDAGAADCAPSPESLADAVLKAIGTSSGVAEQQLAQRFGLQANSSVWRAAVDRLLRARLLERIEVSATMRPSLTQPAALLPDLQADHSRNVTAWLRATAGALLAQTELAAPVSMACDRASTA